MIKKTIIVEMVLESNEDVSDNEIMESIDNGLVVYFTDDGSAGKLTDSVIHINKVDIIRVSE